MGDEVPHGYPTGEAGEQDTAVAGAATATADLASVPDETLRRALELAVGIAAAGAKLRSALPVPAGLRPYLRFTHLPPAALGPVRRAVDADEEFRRRIAAVVTEDHVERAGWLWLVRPDGWDAELAAIARAAREQEDSELDERESRRLARRLEAAERAARRALAEVAAAQADAAAARAELDQERRRRRELEATRERLEAQVARVEREVASARRRAEEAEERSGAAGALAESAARQVETLRGELDEQRETLERTQAERDAALAALEVAPAAPPFDVAAVARAIAAAAASLADAASALQGGTAAPATGDTPGGAAPPAVAAAAPRPSGSRPGRRPHPLPGGVLESSVEAADHLLRLPGVLFLVDGYNVAMAGWPGPPLPAQRTRLLDTLDSLVARGFAPATVVFDGGGDGGPAPGRRGVRVEFTAQGTIADDVLVLRAAEAPAERPVVVATSDRELCERLRRVGANVIGAGALLGLARVAAGEAAGEAGPGR